MALYPYPPAVYLYNFFANSEAEACAFIFAFLAVQPFESIKDAIVVVFVYTYAVVFYRKQVYVIAIGVADIDYRRYTRAAIL